MERQNLGSLWDTPGARMDCRRIGYTLDAHPRRGDPGRLRGDLDA